MVTTFVQYNMEKLSEIINFVQRVQNIQGLRINKNFQVFIISYKS